MACARKVGMKDKVCGSKDTCTRLKLGRRDVACARKNGMKNKVCGPEGCLHESEVGSTGRGMRNKLCGPEGLWYDGMGPAHATSRDQTLLIIPRVQLMPCPVDSHASLIKPYFSCQRFLGP